MASSGVGTLSRANSGMRDPVTGKAPHSSTSTSAILPGPNAGERLAAYFEKFFATIIGISTLGASITFTKIISAPVTPWINYGYDEFTIQTFIATSWLLFVITLVLTSLFASLLSLYRLQAVEAFSTKDHYNKKKTMWTATLVSILLIGLILASFVFLSLVTAAYVGPVGWAALSITAGFGFIALCGIIWQSPLEWPDWVLKLLPRTGKDETQATNSGYLGQGSLGYDAKTHSSSWPSYSKGPLRANILPSTNQKAQSTIPGSNLTGGTILSALRRKPSYTDLQEDKEYGVGLETSRMEESFSTEKEWEAYRSAGGQPMRIRPRVSWPKGGVVSNQFSPPPQQQFQHPPPASSAQQLQRRGMREYRHDRRERMQIQQQAQPQLDPPQESPEEEHFTSSAEHRRSLPPQYQESEEHLELQEHEPEHYEEDHETYDGDLDQGRDAYNDEDMRPDTSSVRHQYETDQQQHHPALHHNSQQVYRTIPPSRRSGGSRPVWEMEQRQ